MGNLNLIWLLQAFSGLTHPAFQAKPHNTIWNEESLAWLKERVVRKTSYLSRAGQVSNMPRFSTAGNRYWPKCTD